METTYFNTNSKAKVLVALDYSPMDDQIIKYLHFIRQYVNSMEISFTHVVPNLLHKSSSIGSPDTEKFKSMVRELLWNKVHSFFSSKEECKNLCINILEGTPYRVIMNQIKTQNIDLLITGTKARSNGSGITSQRIANNTSCDVLFIPENAKENMHKILAPVDFSDNSARALKAAMKLKEHNPEAEIIAVHVIGLKVESYYKNDPNDLGYKTILLNNAKSLYKEFVQKHQISSDEIRPVFIHDKYNNVSKNLELFAQTENVDFVVMGARGENQYENIIYGRVAERFTNYCRNIPILIVR